MQILVILLQKKFRLFLNFFYINCNLFAKNLNRSKKLKASKNASFISSFSKNIWTSFIKLKWSYLTNLSSGHAIATSKLSLFETASPITDEKKLKNPVLLLHGHFIPIDEQTLQTHNSFIFPSIVDEKKIGMSILKNEHALFNLISLFKAVILLAKYSISMTCILY